MQVKIKQSNDGNWWVVDNDGFSVFRGWFNSEEKAVEAVERYHGTLQLIANHDNLKKAGEFAHNMTVSINDVAAALGSTEQAAKAMKDLMDNLVPPVPNKHDTD